MILSTTTRQLLSQVSKKGSLVVHPCPGHGRKIISYNCTKQGFIPVKTTKVKEVNKLRRNGWNIVEK